jgi:ankyrin repeat protein/truncated hemoglobin YjbI
MPPIRPQPSPELEHRRLVPVGEAALSPPPGSFTALGGTEGVARLVDGLYDRIETDAVLRPAFTRNLAHERERQKLFFAGWLGGSSAYFDSEWPPSLHTAHSHVAISRRMAERWLGHFLAALSEVTDDPAVVRGIEGPISTMAMGLVNRTEEPVPGERLRCCVGGEEARALLQSVLRDNPVGIAEASAGSPKLLVAARRELLLLAAARGKTSAIRELLRQGADVNAPAWLSGAEAKSLGLPRLLMTPLCGALAKRREAAVEVLLAHGASYDIFSAAFLGDLGSIRTLLDQAPDLAKVRDPACDVMRTTPLTHAVAMGQIDAARLLLERGAEVGPNSVRLLRAAADRGDEPLVDLLLDHGADADSLGAGDWVRHPAIAAKLVSRGADVNRVPWYWIWMSCTGNSGHKQEIELVRGLLRCGADVTARYNGRTALHHASRAGFVQVVEALIEHGADVNALSDAGRTALDEVETAAPSIDREPVRRLLAAHGGTRGVRASSGERTVAAKT